MNYSYPDATSALDFYNNLVQKIDHQDNLDDMFTRQWTPVSVDTTQPPFHNLEYSSELAKAQCTTIPQYYRDEFQHLGPEYNQYFKSFPHLRQH